MIWFAAFYFDFEVVIWQRNPMDSMWGWSVSKFSHKAEGLEGVTKCPITCITAGFHDMSDSFLTICTVFRDRVELWSTAHTDLLDWKLFPSFPALLWNLCCKFIFHPFLHSHREQFIISVSNRLFHTGKLLSCAPSVSSFLGKTDRVPSAFFLIGYVL